MLQILLNYLGGYGGEFCFKIKYGNHKLPWQRLLKQQLSVGGPG